MSTFLLGLVFVRPLGLSLLVLPAVLLVLALRRGRPRTVATGTFDLWDFGVHGHGRKQRRFPPPGIWLAALALLCGALALAGPREESGGGVTWRVVLDARPSMELPAPGGASTGESRADRGVREAAALLAELGTGADRVEWSSPGRPTMLLEVGGTPPAEWHASPFVGEPVVPSAVDRPGTLFVTDLVPPGGLAQSGLVAVGADACPGPVGVEGSDLVVWNGEGLERKPDAAPRRSVLIRGQEPQVLTRILEAWSEARGLGLTRSEEDASERALILAFQGEEQPTRFRVGRDGWSARATVAGFLDAADGRTGWLFAGAGDDCIVDARPGELRSTLTEMGEPGGDPASFAVSWSALLDDACSRLAGAVSLAERSRSGPPASRSPEPAPRVSGSGSGGLMDAWLTLAAVLALAAAVVVSERPGVFGRS